MPAPSDSSDDDLRDDREQESETGRFSLFGRLHIEASNAIFAVLLALAVVAIVLARAVPARSTTADVALQPALSVTSNVSAGAVVLDGDKVAGQFPLQVSPIQGKNDLTLQAPPFQPISCQFSWPAATLDRGPCHFLRRAPSAVVLSIVASIADLPATLQAQVKQAIATTLGTALPAQQAQIPEGQYYAVSESRQGMVVSAQATTTLTARLTFATNPNQISTPDTTLALSPLASSKEWYFDIALTIGWQFIQPDGSVAGSLSISSLLPAALTLTDQGFQSVAPAATPNGASISLPDYRSQALCEDPMQMLNAQLAIGGHQGQWATYLQAARGIDGCLIDLVSADASSAGTPTDPGSGPLFIGRFGVLLAANAQAHAILPDLPIAPAAEIAAVS
jgi:hypothetical protein